MAKEQTLTSCTAPVCWSKYATLSFCLSQISLLVHHQIFKVFQLLIQVCRRYSDFLALYELLASRFPYRVLPRIPPQALTAFVSGNDSDFAEIRRKSLKRWITFVVTHPVFSKDPIVQVISFKIKTSGWLAGWLERLFGRCLVAEPDKVLVRELNEWVANPLSPGQTSALQIKTRSA